MNLEQTTDRLILRILSADDAEKVLQFYKDNAAIFEQFDQNEKESIRFKLYNLLAGLGNPDGTVMFRNIRIITEGIAAGDPWRPVFCRNHDVIYDNFSFKERPVAETLRDRRNGSV